MSSRPFVLSLRFARVSMTVIVMTILHRQLLAGVVIRCALETFANKIDLHIMHPGWKQLQTANRGPLIVPRELFNTTFE